MSRFVVLALFFGGLLLPQNSLAATLSVIPSTGTYSVGDRVTARVIVSSSDVPMNAVSGTIAFTSDTLSVEAVSKGGSVLNFWVAEPSFSNTSGSIQFEGVSLSGYQGASGTVITITLRALKAGSGTLSLRSGQVLANDGQGTDITSGLSGATYQIVASKPKTPLPTENIITPEPPPPVTSLYAPVISLGEEDSLPSIIGATEYQNANILLTFVPVAGTKLFITGATDRDGNFILPVPHALRNGPYAVNAVVVVNDKQSPPSNTITVEVGGVFVADVSWENATYISLFLIALLTLLIVYLIWRRYFGPRDKSSDLLNRKVREAEEALHKSMNILKQDLSEHIKHSESSGGNTGLEREDIRNIKSDLNDAEQYIEKEIKDIKHVSFDEKN